MDNCVIFIAPLESEIVVKVSKGLPELLETSYRKRFYKHVTITQNEGLFEINLDKRKLKTPLGKVLQIPSEGLAVVVATEWDSQTEKIQLSTMHLTGLCNTALDNPVKQSASHLVDDILEFLETDTLCYRQEEPVEVAQLQREKWDPIIDWIEKWYDVKINSSFDITSSNIPTESKEILKKHLLSYSFWALTGMKFAGESLKSVILTLALINQHISVETAVSLARLEQEFQISNWGNVEWAHDVELAELRSRVAAAMLFVYLSNESILIREKITQ